MLDDNSNSEVLLELNNIEVIYNHVILVLKGVSLTVHKGGITALLGGNGAGKTTTLKAISNLLRSERGEVTKGSINYRGEEIQESNPSDLVRSGVIQVMEGRHCFEHLTVEENLVALIAKIGATMFGSTETTFYVLAVYFGSVGIRKTRHALAAGLIADAVGVITAVFICRILLG